MRPEPLLRVAASEQKSSEPNASVGFYLVRRGRSSDSYKPRKQAREAWTAFGVRSCTRTQERCLRRGRRDCLYQPHKRRPNGLRALRAAPLTPSERAIALTPGQRGETLSREVEQGNLAKTRRSAGARGPRTRANHSQRLQRANAKRTKELNDHARHAPAPRRAPGHRRGHR